MEETEKEKVTLELSVHADAGLNRLARFYQLSKDEVVERLIKKADSKAADEAIRKGGIKAQSLYYDGPSPS